MSFVTVMGRLLASHFQAGGEVPLTGQIFFTPSMEKIPTGEGVHLPAATSVELDPDGRFEIELLSAGFSWEVAFSLRHAGAFVPVECFNFLPEPGVSSVNFADIVPVIDPVTSQPMLRGDDGVGVSAITTAGGELIFTLTDGKQTRIPVPQGIPGTGVDTITLQDDELVFTLSDGSETRIPAPAGAPGTDAPKPTLAVGEVQTLPAGASATAEVTGQSPDFVLSLGLPAGAKGDTGPAGVSAIQEVSGAVTLGPAGASILEFYTIESTKFVANGTETTIPAHSAVVWRRDGSGLWGFQLVQDAWTVPAPAPDVTSPVAGSLSVDTLETMATLTVLGASDDRGIVKYSFSSNAGTTWSAWQSEGNYTFTGLTPSQNYQFRWRVQDDAGNTVTGAIVEKSTLGHATPSNPTVILTDTVASSGTADTGQQYYSTIGRSAGSSMTLSSNHHNGVQAQLTAAEYQDIEFDFTPSVLGGHVFNFWGNNSDSGTRSGIYLNVGGGGVSFFGVDPGARTTGTHQFKVSVKSQIRVEIRGLEVKAYVDGSLKASGVFSQAQRDSMTGPSWVQWRNYNGTHAIDNIKITVYK